MFLAIDAGNSNVVFALYNQHEQKWSNHFRLETHAPKLAAQLSKKVPVYFLEHSITPEDITSIGFSSVVPEINPLILDFCTSFFGVVPYLIQPDSYHKLPISSLRPQEIGTDLMCNVMAAWTQLQSPAIVVDFGTALTFTVLDQQGQILGVSIVPGLRTAIKSLFLNTSKLPDVELRMPVSALGKDTIHAIQAGIMHGYTGLVSGMIAKIREELPFDVKIIATGGLSEILTSLENQFDIIDRNLTLEGLRLITEANGAG